MNHPLQIAPESRATEERPVVTDEGFSMSDENNHLFAALAKAQGEIDAAVKDKVNPFHKSTYADIHSIGQAVKEPLARNDLFYMQLWEKGSSPSEVKIRTMIGHKSGQHIMFTSSMKVANPEDIQKTGSALTYGKRYALSGALGVTSTERTFDKDASDHIPQQVAPKVLNKEVQKKLCEASKKGELSLNAAWKKLSAKDREQFPADQFKKMKEVARNAGGNTTAKPGVVRPSGKPTNSE
tara:strand:- start:3175 stop:3891 length:717 start_codon:yes stop_codon:yes gene_type:complete